MQLGVVSGLDTRNFLRFISRRGLCSHGYSDFGKNFVGADAEIREVFNKNSVKSREWDFNPPATPHFGRLWEAAGKSLKFHMKRVMGEKTLIFEEMATLVN